MYYRRKILLALLQQFGGLLTRTDLQKLLFLFCIDQKKPVYEFIPYKYGCFSFQANQDLATMKKYNQIEESGNNWKITDGTDYLSQLNMQDRIGLVNFTNKYRSLRGDDLIRFVYENHPYYAINSSIAQSLLSSGAYGTVVKLKPCKDSYRLFTIGYEGKSVEYYTNQLIGEDIKVLCDVRRNPFSMKYGFSKNQLKSIVENVGIRYLHIPELGIESGKRQELNTAADYRLLFEDYEMNSLPGLSKEIEALYRLFKDRRRIALTCFEADFHCCHRSIVARAVEKLFDDEYEVSHI